DRDRPPDPRRRRAHGRPRRRERHGHPRPPRPAELRAGQDHHHGHPRPPRRRAGAARSPPREGQSRLRFPILHGLPGSLRRAYSGKLALAPVLAPLLTVGLIATGVDDAVRGFFIERVPLGSSEVRFGELFLGALWPIAASYALIRTAHHGG